MLKINNAYRNKEKIKIKMFKKERKEKRKKDDRNKS